MDNEFVTIKQISESIERYDLFEIIFNNEYKDLTESINNVSFSETNKMLYLYVTDFHERIEFINNSTLIHKTIKHNLNLNNLDKVIYEGLNIVLINRIGDIISKYEFIGCNLQDIAEMKLNYNIDDKYKQYIIAISYDNIVKK